jgi:hypothetical protein
MSIYKWLLLLVISLLSPILFGGGAFDDCFCGQKEETSDAWICIDKGQGTLEQRVNGKQICQFHSSNFLEPTYNYELKTIIQKNANATPLRAGRKCGNPGVSWWALPEGRQMICKPGGDLMREYHYQRKSNLMWASDESAKCNALKAGIEGPQIQEICNHFQDHFFQPITCQKRDGTPVTGEFGGDAEFTAKCKLSLFEDSIIKILFSVKSVLNGMLFDRSLPTFNGKFDGTITCQIFCEAQCRWSCLFSDIEVRNPSLGNSEVDCQILSKDAQTKLLTGIASTVNKYLGSK